MIDSKTQWTAQQKQQYRLSRGIPPTIEGAVQYGGKSLDVVQALEEQGVRVTYVQHLQGSGAHLRLKERFDEIRCAVEFG